MIRSIMKLFPTIRRGRVALLGWLLIAVPLHAVPGSKPNVLIMADDIGYECVSSYGSADYATPRIDQLAREGIRFMHGYSQPVCTPTRVQLLTGQYNVRNYVKFGYLDPAQITFGHDLRAAGYRTGIAGKWQLGGDRNTIPDYGFDEYCLWWMERKSWRYGDVGELIQNGEVLPGERGEYGPDVINAFALNFIENNAERPFFLYYPMMLPHAPFVPTPDSKNATGWREEDPRYFKDMVAYMDQLVGRIVDKLDALGLRENTLVVFMGDNGTNQEITSRMIDGRLIQGGKSTPTDAGTRVPLVVSMPSVVPQGLVSEVLVDFSDLMPTFHDVVGYTPGAQRVIDGVSFWPVLQGESATEREWSYCWYAKEGQEDDVAIFARTIRFKLYADGRMFDLARDPLETSVLSQTSELQAMRSHLRAVIERYAQVETIRQ